MLNEIIIEAMKYLLFISYFYTYYIRSMYLLKDNVTVKNNTCIWMSNTREPNCPVIRNYVTYGTHSCGRIVSAGKLVNQGSRRDRQLGKEKLT